MQCVPRHAQQPLAETLKPRPAPQRQRQVHVAELPRTLDPDALQTNRDRNIPAAVIK
jgi:hypothetical protein